MLPQLFHRVSDGASPWLSAPRGVKGFNGDNDETGTHTFVLLIASSSVVFALKVQSFIDCHCPPGSVPPAAPQTDPLRPNRARFSLGGGIRGGVCWFVLWGSAQTFEPITTGAGLLPLSLDDPVQKTDRSSVGKFFVLMATGF